MKVLGWIARILLFLLFGVLGIDYWFHFIPMPPMPEGDPGVFAGILAKTKYMDVVKFCEVAGAILVLSGRFTPLGLAILIPVTVNILLFTTLVWPQFNPPGMVALLLEIFLVYVYWDRVKGVFVEVKKPAG